MSTESKDFDAYAVVLADLRAQRDRIDQAIQSLESLRGIASSPSSTPPLAHPDAGVAPEEGAFLGMSIAEATKKLLASRKKAMNNASILAELKAGGLVLTANDPINTIGAVLSRRFNEVGDIVRIDRGTWGLKEWYPNRTFGKATKPNGDQDAKSDPSAPGLQPKPDVSAPEG